MTTTILEGLQTAAQAAVKEAHDVATKAADAGRPMSADETSIYEGAMAKGRGLLSQIQTAKADAAILDAAKSLASEIGIPAASDPAVAPVADVKTRVKSLGLQVVESAQFKSVAPAAGSFLPAGSGFSTAPIGVKSLFVGSNRTSAGVFITPDQSGIVETLGRRPLVLRDMISVRPTGSDSVEYVRQTSHVNRAAFVPESTSAAAFATADQTIANGYKPEGDWSYEREVATVKTLAEMVPASKRALSDVASLAAMIDQELSADLDETEEANIIDGDGVGDNLLGLLRTPGHQNQAFDTDVFTTVRRAITKVRVVGRTLPTAVGMNPVDVENLDLARDADGRFYGAGPFTTGNRTLWGLPVIESEAFVAGQAVVADYTKAVLWDREQTTVTMTDSHADFFRRNLIAILAEKREAFAVTRPSAVVLVDLTA